MDMIARKKRLMMLQFAQEQGLPADYLQVEYLEGTGTQWLNTGKTLSQGDKITLKFYMPTNTASSIYWGYRWSGTYTSGCQAYIQNTADPNKWIVVGVRGTSPGIGSDNCFPLDTLNTIVLDTLNNTLTVNGNPASCNFVFSNGKMFNSSGSSVYNPYLFTFNNMGTPSASIANGLKIYEYKVEHNGKEMQNLVPCLRISDSKPGMYDLVGRQFYTNAGTGEFLIPTT